MEREGGHKTCWPKKSLAKKIAGGLSSSSSSCADSSRFSKYSRFSYPLSFKRASLLGKLASKARNLVKSKKNRTEVQSNWMQPTANRNKTAETTREIEIIKNNESRSEAAKRKQSNICPSSPESRNETDSVSESKKQIEEPREPLPMPPSEYEEERSVSEPSRNEREEERQGIEDSDDESEACIEIIIGTESIAKSSDAEKSDGEFDKRSEERDPHVVRNDTEDKSERHPDSSLNKAKREFKDERRVEENDVMVARNETLDSHYKNICSADTMKIRNRAMVDMSGMVQHPGRRQKEDDEPESDFLESRVEWMFWNDEEQTIKEGKHAMIDMCGNVQHPASNKTTCISEEELDYYKYVMKSRKKHNNFVSKLEPELSWRKLYEKEKVSKTVVADGYKDVRDPKKYVMKPKRKQTKLIPKNSTAATRSRSSIADPTEPIDASTRSRSSIAGLAINAIMKLSAPSEESDSSSDDESSSFSGSHDTSISSVDDDGDSSIGDHLMSKILKSQDARIELQAQEIKRLREKQKLQEMKHLRFVNKYNKVIRTIVPREGDDSLDDDLLSELNRAALERHFPSMKMSRENLVDNKENRKSRRKKVQLKTERQTSHILL